jgi:hypothetical protein
MSEPISVDWDSLAAEYRSGALSNVLLGKKYGVSEGAIRKRAKAEGWEKDLAGKVRNKVKEKLVRGEVRGHHVRDADIVDEAANTGVFIVREHRKDIRTAGGIVALLMKELIDTVANRAEIEEAIEEETKADENNQRRYKMLKAISLPTNATVMRDLATAMKGLIPLERQAFNLDELSSEETYEERLARLMGAKE